jgi:hypothetical protein
VHVSAIASVLFVATLQAGGGGPGGVITGTGYDCDKDAGVCTCIGEATSAPCLDMTEYCLGRMTCSPAAAGTPERCTCTYNPAIPWGPGFLGGPRKR